MTRKEIRAFCKAGVAIVQRDMPFGWGRLTEFNSRPNKELPYAWMESPTTTGDPPAHGGATIESWAITLHIADKDQVDALGEHSECIIDACDLIAQKLTQVFDKMLEPSMWVVTTGMRRDPFTKRHADCLSGIILTFTLQAPQNRSFCTDFTENCCDDGDSNL